MTPEPQKSTEEIARELMVNLSMDIVRLERYDSESQLKIVVQALDARDAYWTNQFEICGNILAPALKEKFDSLRLEVERLARNNSGMESWIDMYKPKMDKLEEEISRLKEENERLQASNVKLSHLLRKCREFLMGMWPTGTASPNEAKLLAIQIGEALSANPTEGKLDEND